MSPPVTELTLEVRDGNCMFVAASERAGCTLVGRNAIKRSDGTMLEYFTVGDVAPESALEAIRNHDTVRSARVVQETADGALIEVILEGACVSSTLADSSAAIRSARASDGSATIVADVPSGVDAAAVVDRFFEVHPGSSLVAKRTVPDRVPGIPDGDRAAILEALTEKQRRAFETAFAGGYFEWPRRSSAAECAAALGVSQPTFSQHLRRAQQKLASALFAGEGAADRTSGTVRSRSDTTQSG